MLTLPEIFDSPVRIHHVNNTTFVVSSDTDKITFVRQAEVTFSEDRALRSYNATFSGSTYPICQVEIAKQAGRNAWTPYDSGDRTPLIQGLQFFAAVVLNKQEMTKRIETARPKAKRPTRVLIASQKPALPRHNVRELAAA
jgi:hypothetical protein